MLRRPSERQPDSSNRFILPLLGEYLDSGSRTAKDRFVYSLASNARYYGIALACGLVGLLYVFWQNGLAGTSVKSLVMALAYCVGLVQAVLLLGHGLVTVPRRMIVHADPHRKLRALQLRAPTVHDKMERATVELAELRDRVSQLQRQKNGLSKESQEWIEEIALSLDTIPTTSTMPTSHASIPGVITDRYLAELGRKTMRARHKHIRFVQTWRYLVHEAADTQAILDARASNRLIFPRAQKQTLFTSLLSSNSRRLFYVKFIPALRLGLGSIFALISAFIVWSELVKFGAPQISMVSLTVVRNESVHLAGQIVCSLWILYACTCVLASFDDVKVWGNRALVRRNTYPESACWYALQVAKMTVPLTYNFLTLTPPAVYERTVFYDFMGQLIVLTPLGQGFDYFFPMLILLPVAAALFNLYGRIQSVFRLGLMDDEDSGNWVEGRDLIERELSGRSQDHATVLEDAYQDSPSRGRSLGSRENRGARPAPSRQQPQPRSTDVAAEAEDENIISGWTHRLQNTVASWERPSWLTFDNRPRWMESDDPRPNDNPGESNGFARWFGGRSGQGRIQLS